MVTALLTFVSTDPVLRHHVATEQQQQTINLVHRGFRAVQDGTIALSLYGLQIQPGLLGDDESSECLDRDMGFTALV